MAAARAPHGRSRVVSFIESSFFPIPPDVMLIPMVLSNRREKAWWYATHRHRRLGARRPARLRHRLLLLSRRSASRSSKFYGKEHALDSFIAVRARVRGRGRHHQGHDADPVQGGDDRRRRRENGSSRLHRRQHHRPRHALLSRRGAALFLRPADPRVHRAPADAGNDGVRRGLGQRDDRHAGRAQGLARAGAARPLGIEAGATRTRHARRCLLITAAVYFHGSAAAAARRVGAWRRRRGPSAPRRQRDECAYQSRVDRLHLALLL